MKQLMNLHHTLIDRQFPKFLLQHQTGLVGYVFFTWKLNGYKIPGFSSYDCYIKTENNSIHMDFFLSFCVVPSNNFVCVYNLLISVALFPPLRKPTLCMCSCIEISIAWLKRLLAFVKTIKEIALKRRKKYTSKSLSENSGAHEEVVAMYFEMLWTFPKPVSFINNKCGDDAFCIFLLCWGEEGRKGRSLKKTQCAAIFTASKRFCTNWMNLIK